jgi:hypothetical protein
MAGAAGPNRVATGRGAAFGDYDDDGDVDIAVSSNHGPVQLLRNVSPRRGKWIELRVVNARGADALGASLVLRAGGRTIHREISPCSSYASSNDPRAHFGLGPAAQADEAVVTWPGGAVETFGPLAAEAIHVLKQGTGRGGTTKR